MEKEIIINRPKVTVYITNYNYGRFIGQAIESVFKQKFSDWELLVIDDGSTDNSMDVLKKYESNPKIEIIFQENKGLPISNNIAIRASSGEYLMRLDADDYLDENALLVLSNILDTHSDFGLVYPDYYRIDEKGEIIDIERRNKVGEDITLYDVPAHGACTMIRKTCLEELDGYSEDITCQDGYDLWIRFIKRYKIYNVNLPLFYYRQHGKNLTKDKDRLLKTRRGINRRYVEKNGIKNNLHVLGIIPVRDKRHHGEIYPLRDFCGKPLIDYTIEAALGSNAFKRIVLVSEDDDILNHVKDKSGITTLKRPDDIGRVNASIEPTINYVFDRLNNQCAEIKSFMMLYVNSPFRTASHINAAIDTMLIFDDIDSVISVCEDSSSHYQHIGSGLRPLFPARKLRLEREGLLIENGAIYLARKDNLKSKKGYLGDKIGHIIMHKRESLQIDNEDDFRLAEYIFRSKLCQ